MSGLSASTSSCGGDGGRLGRGGETTGGGATSFVAFFAFMKMGANFLISSSGAAEESELVSESESMMDVWCARRQGVRWWFWDQAKGAHAGGRS